MNKSLVFVAIVMMTLITIGTTETTIMAALELETEGAATGEVVFIRNFADRAAPVAISGDNVYAAWWTNDTGNEEVIFRASTDGGATFSDQINLSNTTDADSTTVEIDSDADSVVVTWWETNQTDDTPVMRVSNDNGATFGPALALAINGTLVAAAEGEEEG